MLKIKSKLHSAVLGFGIAAISAVNALAAADDVYSTNDLLLFFQNPAGTTGTDQVVYYSLGSTYNVFRDAATPSSGSFGTTISLGNINTILTTTFGADWTGGASSIFTGAAGQNGATNGLSTAISNGDYARTVYVTKPRTSVGTVGQANSSSPLYDPASTAVAGNISGSNNISSMTQPGAVGFGSTTIDTYNPFSNGNPATAYGAIQGGIQGAIGSQFTFGNISGAVAALDLFRVTKTTGTNAADATVWQVANNITATYSGSYPGGGARADYLGTIVVGANGDVNFTAVPEPSTYALLGVAGIAALVAYRRRKTQKA
ncbi:MAG: PEP-CTERM sorting domain-containing protein [Verrucomicrobiota bacterium]